MTLSIDDLEALLDAGWEVPEEDRWRKRRLTDEEFAEDYQWLRSSGVDCHRMIAKRMGVGYTTLMTRIVRQRLDRDVRDQLEQLIESGREFTSFDLTLAPSTDAAGGYIRGAIMAGRVEASGPVGIQRVFRGVA
ncbi:hypothetical protein HH308_06490 [Gordonia sp. TBRC 11910]|uniref:Uncharacterized protein n=1 Tax=Gordonia asplenii TaxID=2725283 RepID=A0A848KR52_9ACTN|nr:hypothetical protein [Gordonia asplenii]NMO00860.1 hypothetical protein [Gordonia asplenii]